MKKKSLHLLTLSAIMLWSVNSNAQNIFSQETFPNTYNTAGTAGFDGSFAGGLGTWATVTSSIFNMEVDALVAAGPSAPNGLRIAMNSASTSTVIGDNVATAPVFSLNFGGCQPSSLAMEFQLYPADVDNGNTAFVVGLQFSNDGGTNWTTVWSQNADWINDNLTENAWNSVSVNVSATYWAANFRYRFFTTKAAGGNNSTDLWIDDVQLNASTSGPTIPSFLVANRVQTAGSNNASVDVGDEFTYSNVITVPYPIKAVITIEAMVNATIPTASLDNEGAGISQRFQPQVTPSPASMTADQTGYVQFKIEFRKMSDNTLEALSGLRYRHFDVDGNINTGNYSFREAGWVTGHSSLLVNIPTDLFDAGNITDAGPPNPTTWRRMYGELVEHTSISNDPDVYFTATYGSISTIRFRLGYVFDKIAAGASGDYSASAREYGTEFGCFSLANQIPTPVKLLSFTGTYKNNAAMLNWTVENQLDFSGYEIERSVDGNSYIKVGTKDRSGMGLERQQYQFPDDLSLVNSNVIYYRLKMIDLNGDYKYSNVIMLRKDGLKGGLSISPNPVTNSGLANVRFETDRKGVVDILVMDMSGKVVLRQQNQVNEGTNSLSINNMNRLQPGMYMLQLNDGQAIQSAKLSVIR